ncbi:MAG: Ig-like domain-containing protein, partial [Proteobacteria bacterium]|nr:Ig-like domain-containing protein [Pseudomonadota bacterium]
MKTKSIFLIAATLICTTLLVGCKNEKENGKEWVTLEVTIVDSSRNPTQSHAIVAGTRTALVIAVAETVSTATNVAAPSDDQILDKALQEEDGSVSLTVPLDTSIRLIKATFFDEWTAEEALTQFASATSIGLSGTITVAATDTEKTIAITLNVPPSLNAVSPPDVSSDIPVNANIYVTFSRTMHATTVTADMSDDACSGALQVSSDDFTTCVVMTGDPSTDVDGLIFILDPSSDLDYETTFKIRITRDVRDLNGNTLADVFTTANGFTTGVEPDETAPEVSSVSPANGATDVAIDPSVTVTFSEGMNVSTITTNAYDTSCSGTFQLSDDGFDSCVQMASDPSADDDQTTFTVTPASDLAYYTTYQTRITTDAKDPAANGLESNYTTADGFTTVVEPDTTAPEFSTVGPTDGSTDVAIDTSVAVTFNEAMDTSSITTNTANTTCSGTFQVSTDNFDSCVQMTNAPSTDGDATTFTVTPASDLEYDTTHDVRITTGATDAAGNALETSYQTSDGFTTGAEPDTTVPTVTAVSPNDADT